MPSITVDPDTGIKSFDTRAASRMGNVEGKGYSVVEGEGLVIGAAHRPRGLAEVEADAIDRVHEKSVVAPI